MAAYACGLPGGGGCAVAMNALQRLSSESWWLTGCSPVTGCTMDDSGVWDDGAVRLKSAQRAWMSRRATAEQRSENSWSLALALATAQACRACTYAAYRLASERLWKAAWAVLRSRSYAALTPA